MPCDLTRSFPPSDFHESISIVEALFFPYRTDLRTHSVPSSLPRAEPRSATSHPSSRDERDLVEMKRAREGCRHARLPEHAHRRGEGDVPGICRHHERSPPEIRRRDRRRLARRDRSREGSFPEVDRYREGSFPEVIFSGRDRIYGRHAEEPTGRYNSILILPFFSV
ncbi:hypothetical protein ACLOJK_009414 [Asimina triloba]